jgi:hypothetical protein
MLVRIPVARWDCNVRWLLFCSEFGEFRRFLDLLVGFVPHVMLHPTLAGYEMRVRNGNALTEF